MIADIIHAEPNGTQGAVIVTVRCPFCKQTHTHGITPTDQKDLFDCYSGRLAECVTTRGFGAYLVHDPRNLVEQLRDVRRAVAL